MRTLSAVWFCSCTKRVKPRVSSGSPNAGALLKSLNLLEGLSLFRFPPQGLLTRPCCGYKQRLHYFRETWSPDQQNAAAPTHGLLSWFSTEVLNGWLLSSHVQVPNALLR